MNQRQKTWIGTNRQAYNSQKMNDLTLGQNIGSVKELLGKADFSEAKAVKEAKLQVLFYRTHHEKSDGVTTKEECTPLIFENDKLIAWGQDTYRQYLDAGTDTVLTSAHETLSSK